MKSSGKFSVMTTPSKETCVISLGCLFPWKLWVLPLMRLWQSWNFPVKLVDKPTTKAGIGVELCKPKNYVVPRLQ